MFTNPLLITTNRHNSSQATTDVHLDRHTHTSGEEWKHHRHVTGIHHGPPLHCKSPSNPNSNAHRDQQASLQASTSLQARHHTSIKGDVVDVVRHHALRRGGRFLNASHHRNGGLQHRPAPRRIPRHGGRQHHNTMTLHPNRRSHTSPGRSHHRRTPHIAPPMRALPDSSFSDLDSIVAPA
jgi:hypothetical protein